MTDDKAPTYFTDKHAQSMTLRDHFAGLAMQGLLSNVAASDNITEVPRVCYLLADAMLKAREA